MARQTPLDQLHGMKGASRPANTARPVNAARPAEGGPNPRPATSAVPSSADPATKATARATLIDALAFAAASVWPAWLWWKGSLLATDVLVMFVAEAMLYHASVLARMLFTTASPERGQMPRLISAIRHAIGHGIWMGILVVLLLLAIGTPFDPAILADAARAHFARLSLPPMAQAASVVAACFAFAVIVRGDHIDTYLAEPPSRFARYGFSYVFGLGVLLVASLIVRIVAEGEGFLPPTTQSSPGSPLIPPAILVICLLMLRLLLKTIGLLYLIFQGRFAGAIDDLKRRAAASGRGLSRR